MFITEAIVPGLLIEKLYEILINDSNAHFISRGKQNLQIDTLMPICLFFYTSSSLMQDNKQLVLTYQYFFLIYCITSLFHVLEMYIWIEIEKCIIKISLPCIEC